MGCGNLTLNFLRATPGGVGVRLAGVLLLAVVATACGDPEPEVPEGTITRDQFRAAWVDLRFVALEAGLPEPTPEARDSVLAAHDLTASDLFDFLEVHGRDVDYMRELWEELEDTMEVVVDAPPYS